MPGFGKLWRKFGGTVFHAGGTFPTLEQACKRKIAKKTGVPRTTVRDALKGAGKPLIDEVGP